MFTRIRRWGFTKLDRLNNWREAHDLCEICKESYVGYTCVGCGRRICVDCESGYYADEDLCDLCRRDITPEEEAKDRKGYAKYATKKEN